MATETLRTGHNQASFSPDMDNMDSLDKDAPVSQTLETYYQKNEDLRGVPGPVIRKAWFTMSHLMVSPGATILDMGCNPIMTYAMAAMSPHANFIGVDLDKKMIGNATKNFVLPNLEYRTGDIADLSGIEPESADAVINSFILHEIYSNHHYSDRAIVSALEKHFSLLKPEGLMFIRDFSTPPPEEYVLLEMPDVESRGEALEDLSEPDLLVWFSENARPRGDAACKGFFLEELPPKFPKTRLFRLLYKWAYEFMMRKDNREDWEKELPKEYTFFTPREYRKNLRGIGARVLYTAPQWDDAIIRDRFEGYCRLYEDGGKPLGMPPTSFVAIAQKMGEKKSLRLQERRPSNNTENKIQISAMKDERTGKIFDIVSRDVDITEILPYRVTASGQLNVFIHEGLPRGIANAVPRTGKQLDLKRWSGHMTEAISVPTESVYDAERQGDHKAAVLFARDYLGLKPVPNAMLIKGPSFYPAPDFIDDQIKTRYIEVNETNGPIDPKVVMEDLDGFTTKGRIRELNAQHILDAISVGYIPNSQLEIQILELFERLGMEAETWTECPLSIDEGTPENKLDTRKLIEAAADKDSRMKDVKGKAGTFRMVKSIFVDEGWVDGGIGGLAARDIEFAIPEEQTINKAVILPLTKSAETGDILVGMNVEFLPVPQRRKGNGLSLRVPSVNLPKEISSIYQAKKFVAEQFGTTPDKVGRMGESYFCHIGMTPIRIFPFCVATTGKRDGPLGGPVQYAPLQHIGHLFGILDPDDWTQDRKVLCIYKKVLRRQGFGTEVTGTWEMSGRKVYEQMMDRSPGILNSAPVLSTERSGSAPAAEQAAQPAGPSSGGTTSVVVPEETSNENTEMSGLERSGWTVAKSKEKIAEAKAIAAAKVASSPDFVDIQHESFNIGHTAKTDHEGSKNEQTNDPEHKTQTGKE